MEETIGYEALVPIDQWDSLELAEWDAPPHAANITYDTSEKSAFRIDCEFCGPVGSAPTTRSWRRSSPVSTTHWSPWS